MDPAALLRGRVSYHHVVSFFPWEDSSTTITATTTNDHVIRLLVSRSPDRPPPLSPSPSPPLLTGSDRHRHHRGAIAIATKTNKTRRKAVANVAGGGHSGRKRIWCRRRWLDEERLWLSKLRVLLPLALALLKGEGKFTARVGRVKIYYRASVDGRRPDGSRGVSGEAVKVRRKSNNDCQEPTQTYRGWRKS